MDVRKQEFTFSFLLLVTFVISHACILNYDLCRSQIFLRFILALEKAQNSIVVGEFVWT